MGNGFRGHKTIRLRDFDYAAEHNYFITIVTSGRICNLSRLIGADLQLSAYGRIAPAEWQNTLGLRKNLTSHRFLVMPNHIHILMGLRDDATYAEKEARPRNRYQLVVPNSVSAIIRAFKAEVTKKVNRKRGLPGARYWQDGFYDHVVRSEEDFHAISAYIDLNPLWWRFDRENGEGIPDEIEREFWKNRMGLIAATGDTA